MYFSQWTCNFFFRLQLEMKWLLCARSAKKSKQLRQKLKKTSTRSTQQAFLSPLSPTKNGYSYKRGPLHSKSVDLGWNIKSWVWMWSYFSLKMFDLVIASEFESFCQKKHLMFWSSWAHFFCHKFCNTLFWFFQCLTQLKSVIVVHSMFSHRVIDFLKESEI